MAAGIRVDLLRVGSCRHSERIAMRGGTWRSVTFPSLCALLRHPSRGAALYDTGYADHFVAATRPFPERLYRWTTPMALPEHERLATQLARLGLAADDVQTCLISHFHADHVAGLRDLPAATFVASRADHDAMRRASRWGGLRRGLLPALLPDDFGARLRFADDAPRRPLPGRCRELGEGHDVFGDGSVFTVALPGHTAAQMGLVLRDDRGRELLLCADAAWSGRAIRERRLPAWPVRLLVTDWAGYRATLDRLHELACREPELAIVPSHCAASAATYEAGAR